MSLPKPGLLALCLVGCPAPAAAPPPAPPKVAAPATTPPPVRNEQRIATRVTAPFFKREAAMQGVKDGADIKGCFVGDTFVAFESVVGPSDQLRVLRYDDPEKPPVQMSGVPGFAFAARCALERTAVAMVSGVGVVIVDLKKNRVKVHSITGQVDAKAFDVEVSPSGHRVATVGQINRLLSVDSAAVVAKVGDARSTHCFTRDGDLIGIFGEDRERQRWTGSEWVAEPSSEGTECWPLDDVVYLPGTLSVAGWRLDGCTHLEHLSSTLTWLNCEDDPMVVLDKEAGTRQPLGVLREFGQTLVFGISRDRRFGAYWSPPELPRFLLAE